MISQKPRPTSNAPSRVAVIFDVPVAMKTAILLLMAAIGTGCSHVVQREISVFPTVQSRVADRDVSRERMETLTIGGHYLQRAVLRFTIDSSSVAYVNDLLSAEGLSAVRAVRLLDFGFYTKTEVWSLPLGRTSWFANIAIEFEPAPDGADEVARADIQIEVPPAHVFLAPATTGRGIDDELLGEAMSRFVAETFRAAAVELVKQLKRPKPALRSTTMLIAPRSRRASRGTRRHADL